MSHSVRILGLDPGLRRTGWGVIESQGNKLSYIACGVLSIGDKQPLAARLRAIHDGIQDVVKAHLPHEAAVEETFVNANPASTLKLGQARGIAMLVPALCGLDVAEYAATLVKKSVVGTGHAEKAQIRHMVETLLPKAEITSEDAADALAIAICHAHHRKALVFSAPG